jgi:hypothetical protein
MWQGHGGLVESQVRRDLADAGVGDEASVVVDGGVQGDVFEDHPRGRADRPLDVAAGREDFGEGFGAADDAPVGQHSADLPTERDHVPRLQPLGGLGRHRRRGTTARVGRSGVGLGWWRWVAAHADRRDDASASHGRASARGAFVEEWRGGVDTR